MRVTPLQVNWANHQRTLNPEGATALDTPESSGGAQQRVRSWRDAWHVGRTDASEPRRLGVGADDEEKVSYLNGAAIRAPYARVHRL